MGTAADEADLTLQTGAPDLVSGQLTILEGPMDQSTPKFISKSELAENLGISLPSINRGLKLGTIPSVKLGGRVLIPASFIQALETQATGQAS